jgi:adenosylcobalamin-dependent ribonucleoside-triphosphate reductase
VRDFKLSQKFLEDFRGKQPNWGFGALSYVTYKRSYARLIEGEDRVEEFWETIRRVVEGTFTIQKQHCTQHKLYWDNKKAQRSAQTMFMKMWEFKFLPPGRGLWMMGTNAIEEKGGGGLNNCGFTSTENIETDFAGPFCWAMDFLMLGVGVGFDTRGAGKVLIQEPIPAEPGNIYVIPDTREGWIEALEKTLNAFAKGVAVPKYDYSQIRPEGVPIKTFGGTSSGHAPLKSLLETVRALLTKSIDDFISDIDIVDIFNYIGKCVVSGNVRRSAEIACGDPYSEAFLRAKDPEINSEALGDRRWASNNSLLAEVGMDYEAAAAYTARNGEPGYIWLENARKFGRMRDAPNNKDYRIGGFNPCAEQGLEDKELCNLVETFPANHDSKEEFMDTLKYAFMYAKTVTLIMSHDPRTNGVMIRNRRIGTSMSGIEQAKKKFGIYHFYHDFCDEGYKVIEHYDKIYSEWLGIALSIKLTTVKPSGTVSLLAGATPGVHAAHSKYYYRTIRIAHNSPYLQPLLDAGFRAEYGATEWKPDYDEVPKEDWLFYVTNHPIGKKVADWFSGTVVVYFPVEEKNFTKGKKDQTIWEQAENAAKMQYYWSDNSVSVTINMFEEEKHLVSTILEHYQTRMKTISFLPFEHGYAQAPYQELTEEEYKKASKGLKKIKFKGVVSEREVTDGYCESDRCELGDRDVTA